MGMSKLAVLLFFCGILVIVTLRGMSHDMEKDKMKDVVHIMAVVPTEKEMDSTKSLSTWKRGEDLLQGAYLAAREAGEILPVTSYRIEVIPIKVSRCDLNEGIVPLVKELTSDDNNIIGIVGYFCHNIARRFSEVIQHKGIDILQISATSIAGRDGLSHIQHSILPLSQSIGRAVVQLSQTLQWNKVAIVSNQDANFLDIKSAFLNVAKEQGIEVVLKLETSASPLVSSKELLRELQNVGAKIIIAFLPLRQAIDVLCVAQNHGYIWPNYAWIFAELSIINNIPSSSKFCSQNTTFHAMNGTIFVYPHLHKNASESDINNNYGNDTFDELYTGTNPYASVLYDSIWAFVHTLNRSLDTLKERNLSLAHSNSIGANSERHKVINVLKDKLSKLTFQGETGTLNFTHSAAALQAAVDIAQFQNGQPINVGSYMYTPNHLAWNKDTLLGDTPSDTLSRVYLLYPKFVTAILIVFIAMSFVFTIVLMCVYFRYRNTPAIKATSTTLSSCLFIGCYFLLTSSLFHTINSGIIRENMNDSYRAFICMFDIYLINMGIDLVLATIVAKTLRIYHIFKRFGKVGRLCTDQSLFLLILAIVSVKAIFLIIWTCVDVSRLVDREEYVRESIPPYFLVTQECQNKHPAIWFTLQYVYSTALALTMVVLAILTRRIERGDFKNTKKINILVAMLVTDMCVGFSLWLVLRLVGFTTLSRVAYAVGITTAALLCQVFLILPKIVPLSFQNSRCLNLKLYVCTSYKYFSIKKTSDNSETCTTTSRL